MKDQINIHGLDGLLKGSSQGGLPEGPWTCDHGGALDGGAWGGSIVIELPRGFSSLIVAANLGASAKVRCVSTFRRQLRSFAAPPKCSASCVPHAQSPRRSPRLTLNAADFHDSLWLVEGLKPWRFV